MQPTGNYWQEKREKCFNYDMSNHVRIMELHINANRTHTSVQTLVIRNFGGEKTFLKPQATLVYRKLLNLS